MSTFASYLISGAVLDIAEIEMAPGITFRGLPEGLGALQHTQSPIARIFSKSRSEDQGTAIRLSISPRHPVTAEAILSPEAHERFFESYEAALAIKTILIIVGHGNAEIPVALSVPIWELASAEDRSVAVTDIDLHKGGLRYHFKAREALHLPDHEWVWDHFLGLLYGDERDRFKLAIEAVEASRYAYDPRFALAALWVAAESIFAKDPSEATFKLTAAWASFVESAGEERLKLQRELVRLYGLRSKAVHGHRIDAAKFREAYAESFVQFMHCLWLFVESGQLPTAATLQDAMFLDPSSENE